MRGEPQCMMRHQMCLQFTCMQTSARISGLDILLDSDSTTTSSCWGERDIWLDVDGADWDTTGP